jgi:hypothetical protein
VVGRGASRLLPLRRALLNSKPSLLAAKGAGTRTSADKEAAPKGVEAKAEKRQRERLRRILPPLPRRTLLLLVAAQEVATSGDALEAAEIMAVVAVAAVVVASVPPLESKNAECFTRLARHRKGL